MFTNFSQAQLAIVAYAEVSGADGSSTKTNSGIATTQLGLGTYALDLPNGSALFPQNLTQFSDRDLIFVQVLNATQPLATSAVNDSYAYGGNTATRKIVFIGSSATTAVNADFSVIILRTLTPPVVGGPA